MVRHPEMPIENFVVFHYVFKAIWSLCLYYADVNDFERRGRASSGHLSSF
jgi:hypothetical protein